MFRWVGKVITRYAPVVIIVLLIISMVFALLIPKVEFKTNLNKFLPDNELVRANERVNDFFGDENIVHLIYVEEDNSAHDLLTPSALREQYDIYQTISNMDDIVTVIGLGSIFDELFSMLEGENYTGFNDLSDAQLEGIKPLFFGVLNGSLSIDFINQALPPEFQLTIDELRQLVDIFFDKGFNYNAPEPMLQSTLVLVLINGSLKSTIIKQITEDLRTSITTDDYMQLTVSHTGGYVLSSDLDEASSESFSVLGIVIIILIALILLLTFRRLSYMLIPLITLALAVVWTFGTMLLLGIEFTVITVAIVPLIIGLGVDYSVYVSKRYQEELRRGRSISEAMENAIGSVGTAMFLAVLTTIIAFMSNMTSDIIPVREFGLVCGLGIFFAFFLTLTFHTSLRWLIDIKSSRKPVLHKENELYLIELGTSTASRSVFYYPALVMVVVIMITIGGILFGINVRTEFNDKDFLPSEWESMQTQVKLEESFNASSFSQAYILLEVDDKLGGSNADALVTVAALEGIQAIEDNIKNDKYVVRVNNEPRIESVLTYVKSAISSNGSLAAMVDQNNDSLPDSNDAVETVFDYLIALEENQTIADVTGDGYIEFIRPDVTRILYRDNAGVYSSTVIRVYIHTKDSEEVREMYDELGSDMTGVEISGVQKSATGDVILTVTTMDSLQESQIISTIVSVIFALVILIIIYRNLVLGLIAITPVVISSIWILGTMYIFSISINVFTVSITALTIGLGIDYAIHIIERFREEYKQYNTRKAIHITIRSTGTALFISALTTVCGFIVLTISPIPPIQHFGIITALTITYSSILAVVVIPILLMRWAKNHG
jgi:predicted RND superfamily exporter protein